MKAPITKKVKCVYALVCPIRKKIVYVGKTIDLATRIVNHKAGDVKSASLAGWYAELKGKDLLDEIKVVIVQDAEGKSDKELMELEKLWIQKMQKDYKLFNVRRTDLDVMSSTMTLHEYRRYEKHEIMKINAM